MVTHWTGRTACALQAALRMSNDAFAGHLYISVRTVAGWHEKPEARPQLDKQQLLDTALARASEEARDRFAALAGLAPGLNAHEDQVHATADAEHRLISDQNISGALTRLDELAGWGPGTARRQVAERLTGLDRRDVLDRASRRRRIGRQRTADALGQYYGGQAREHGRYTGRCAGSEIATSVLTRPDWLDLATHPSSRTASQSSWPLTRQPRSP